jgi:hypothetical protein
VARRLVIRQPKVAVSDQISMPVVYCIGSPRILWPGNLSEPEVVNRCEGVLAHELAHLARRDHYVLYFELAVALCCWWNPLTWMIRRFLRESRELACDALALTAFAQRRGEYAQRLLDLSASRSDTLAIAPAFGAGILSRRFLRRRIDMVFDPFVQGRVTPRGLVLGLVLATVALPGLSLADPQGEQSDISLNQASNKKAAQPSATPRKQSEKPDRKNQLIDEQQADYANVKTLIEAIKVLKGKLEGLGMAEATSLVNEESVKQAIKTSLIGLEREYARSVANAPNKNAAQANKAQLDHFRTVTRPLYEEIVRSGKWPKGAFFDYGGKWPFAFRLNLFVDTRDTDKSGYEIAPGKKSVGYALPIVKVEYGHAGPSDSVLIRHEAK